MKGPDRILGFPVVYTHFGAMISIEISLVETSPDRLLSPAADGETRWRRGCCPACGLTIAECMDRPVTTDHSAAKVLTGVA